MSGGIVDSAGASATTIKNAVWNALTSAHTTAGSFGVLLKDELAKFGTLVNTGGTATLGGMIGDTANSTIVQRLDAIPTTSAGGSIPDSIYSDNYAQYQTVAAGSAGVYGSYVEFSPNIGVEKTLVAIMIKAVTGTLLHWNCDIAEGASGSEVVKTRVSGFMFGGGQQPVVLLLNKTLTASSRISCRTKCSWSSESLQVQLMWADT